jgi:hypothetical protein
VDPDKSPLQKEKNQMSTQNLIRWSGLALMVGGVGIALFLITLYPLGNFLAPETIITSQSILAHTFHWIGATFALLGLVGWHVKQKAQAGMTGLIGFILAFIGTTLTLVGGVSAGYIFPVLAHEAPHAFDPQGPLFASSNAIPFFIGFATFMLGYVLLGIATIRAKILPRWGAVLVMVGAILFQLPPQPIGPFPTIVILLGAVLYGAGTVWIGLALWSSKSEMTAPT